MSGTLAPQSAHDLVNLSSLPKFIGESSTFINSNPADYALTGKSANGRRTYISRLNQVARFFQFNSYVDVPWHLLRQEHVQYVVKAFKANNVAPATINTTLSTLRAVAREAFYLGQLGGEDLARILHIKLEKSSRPPAGRYISAHEIAALVTVCEGEEDPSGIRDIAIIGLLYFCGLRRIEIAQLRISDFDQTDQSLRCTGRSANEQQCWPDQGTIAALLDWYAIRKIQLLSDDSPVFTPVRKSGQVLTRAMTDQSIYNMIGKRSKQAGLLPCTPNDFRHSFVTNLLDNNVDVLTVQRLADHSSPATTMRYDRRTKQTIKPVTQIARLPYAGRSGQSQSGES